MHLQDGLRSQCPTAVAGVKHPIAEGERSTHRAWDAACVDGSEFSELSVDEGALWSVALGVPLRIVQVVPLDLPSYVTVFENTYVQNLSRDLLGAGSQAIEGEVLHSASPAKAILDSFGEDPATMLVMATHGRVGFRRVIMGSVASEVVRGARGPVALIRPLESALSDSAVD